MLTGAVDCTCCDEEYIHIYGGGFSCSIAQQPCTSMALQANLQRERDVAGSLDCVNAVGGVCAWSLRMLCYSCVHDALYVDELT